MNSVLQKLLRLRKVLMGKDLYVSRQVKCPQTTLGDGFNAWTVNPVGLNNNSIIYSFGVGLDVSFELQLIEICNARIHTFDPTPKSINWIKTIKLPDNFIFHPIGIASQDGKIDFFLPRNDSHVSGSIKKNITTGENKISVPVSELGSIMNKLGHKHLDLLKMDIEGSEYEVIEYITKHDIKIDQMLVEFHHRFEGNGIAKTKKTIKMLNHKGYRIFHVSPNGEEISFIRK